MKRLLATLALVARSRDPHDSYQYHAVCCPAAYYHIRPVRAIYRRVAVRCPWCIIIPLCALAPPFAATPPHRVAPWLICSLRCPRASTRSLSYKQPPLCVCTTSHTPRLTAGGGVYHSCCPPSPPLAKPARAPFSRERHSHATPSHATPSHVICATAVSAPTLLLLPARGDMDAHSRSFFAASARPR